MLGEAENPLDVQFVNPCLVEGNVRSGDLLVDAAGSGGINNNNGTLTVINCTFSDNSAGTGSSGGAAGGINNQGGTVTVTNTIVANSTAGGNCAGTATRWWPQHRRRHDVRLHRNFSQQYEPYARPDGVGE